MTFNQVWKRSKVRRYVRRIVIECRQSCRWFTVPAAAVVVFMLSGCGASPASPVLSQMTPSAAALGGNWLIVGSLPFANLATPVTSNGFGFAMTFAVAGNNLVVETSQNLVCGIFSGSGNGPIATGTVASDGTFTLATATTGATLQMSATAPAAGASSFSGTYSYTTTGSCASTQSGSFTATRIADVTGTYVGTSAFSTVGSLGTQSATLTLNLQQGAAVSGSTATDQALLVGTISVKGLSCVSTGTLAAPTGTISGSIGGMQGSKGVASFAMNDGSTLELIFDDENTGSTKLAVSFILDTKSACGSLTGGSFELVKQ